MGNSLAEICSKMRIWKGPKDSSSSDSSSKFNSVNIFDTELNDSLIEINQVQFYLVSISIKLHSNFNLNVLFELIQNNHISLITATKDNNFITYFFFIFNPNQLPILNFTDIFSLISPNLVNNDIITPIPSTNLVYSNNSLLNKLISLILAYINKTTQTKIDQFSFSFLPSLSLKPIDISDIIEDDEEPIEDLDEEYYSPPTHRNDSQNNVANRGRTNKTSENFSEIIENFLYVGNYKAATDRSVLKALGITHIINACGSLCDNIIGTSINFLTINVYDNVGENIECIFFKCFEFITDCKNSENGKILIHCYKGISRSVSIVIAYLMYIYKMPCKEAINYVQSIRTIASPNFGFTIQLESFFKRITAESNRLQIYAVCSFQEDQPDLIVCRLIFSTLIRNTDEREGKVNLVFDQRGVFIVCDLNNTFLISCSKVSEKNLENYKTNGRMYIELIRKYEHIAKGDIVECIEGEYENYIKLLNENNITVQFGKNKDLDKYYIEYDEEKIKAKQNKMLQENEEEETSKKAFYFYPNEKPYLVLNLDDLTNEEFMLACVENEKGEKLIYNWKGYNFDQGESQIANYISFVTKDFFTSSESIIEKKETPFEESDDFLKLLF